MIKKNNKISAFQIFVIGAMIGNSLFVGMGTIITIIITKENAWMVALISSIIGIIPILILSKIMDHLPDTNILEKNKKIFGKIIGHIVNFIIFVIVTLVFFFVIWGLGDFSNLKYLTETPFLFVTLIFLSPAIYACAKGIETIARTTQIIFFLSLAIIIIITISMTGFVDIDNIKPFLKEGISPIINGVLNFLSYALVPFIALLIIPKNEIVCNEKLKKNLILGYVFAALTMALVFFVIISSVGINLASLYRFPEYYIIKKVSIGDTFDNIENFLSIHWIFNMFSAIMLCLYFIKEYFINLFKVEKEIKKKFICVAIGLVSAYIVTTFFSPSTFVVHFIRHQFPFYLGLGSLLLITLIFLVILIKNKFKK